MGTNWKTLFSIVICAAVCTIASGASPEDSTDLEILELPDGNVIHKIIVPGHRPPAVKVACVSPPAPNLGAGINVLSDVPTFDWSYGCSATSAAMMAGHYDRTGYPNMYSGPTNGGLCPLDNSLWGYGECPLSATHQGYDGRVARGHVDDYWVSYNSPSPDPYIGNWTEHTHGDCTGDYMKTNQSAYGITDGATAFGYLPAGAPYSGTVSWDGGYGLELFMESRGYTVNARYNQYIAGWDGPSGFTFAQFRDQIDDGRPVLIHVQGHTMLGIGYNTTGSLIYIHDTWDHCAHQMTWGGTYSGMTQYAVTVVELENNTSVFTDGFESSDCTEWSSTVP
jgi:hypothetical protein